MTVPHAPASTAPPALAVHNIQIVYGGAIEAVRAASLEVGPRLFATLTGEENRVAGAHLQNAGKLAQARGYVFELFPRLAEMRRHTAGYLSGGEQQMVAI